MFHCPNCHQLIKNGTQYCPHCGYRINYDRPQSQIHRPTYYYPPKPHHYGCGVFLAIIVILIGGAIYFYSSPKGHQATQQTISKVTSRHVTNSHTVNGGHNFNNHGHHHFLSNVFHHHSNDSTDVNQPGYTLSVMPSNIQGTWYSYDNGKLDTIEIGPKSYRESGMPETVTIHPRKKNKNIDASKISQHKTWAIALPAHVRGLSYTNLLGWNQSAGDGISFAEFDHKGTIILDEASGADFDTDANFFRTKALAKLFKKKIFKDAGEKGYPD